MKRTKKKIPPITTLEMELAIAEHFGYRDNIIVPNISWGIGMHECDMFIVRKNSGLCIEVEIKRSKSDLLADFKKGHNHIDRKNRIKEFYYCIPENLLKTCEELIPKDAGLIVCRRSEWNNRVYANIKRKPKINSTAVKLTDDEILKVAHLGTMRIWSLKKKIITLKNEATISKQTKSTDRKGR